MANWLTYRIKVGDDVLVLADEEAQELIKNETERSKKADAQIASFLESTATNGIIRNSKSDPFGQTAIGGMKVVIDKGDLIIKGNIKNHARLTRTYNVTQENRTEVFLYRFDSATNEITGLWRDCIIQGDIILSREDKTELPLRSSGYYDILICKITIPAGATEITQDMIGDFRQNEYYCGYAKILLVDIDETLTKSGTAADAAAVGAGISDLRNETRTRDIITEKRITNLEAGLPAERWSVDDSVAYIKDVPENALPFASVDMIGGMTYKDGDVLRSAPVTEVVSVGVNLIPYPYAEGTSKTSNGITFSVDENGVITATGTATGTAVYFVGAFGVKEGVTYTISSGLSGSGGDSYQMWLNSDETIGYSIYTIEKGTTFTPIKSGSVSLSLYVYYGSTVNIQVYPMLNKGATALPYEPCRRNTLPIPAEVQALDGFGWGVNADCYNYIDLEKKQFVKRVGCVDLGTLNWTYQANRYYQATLADIKPSGWDGNKGNIVCGRFMTDTNNNVFAGVSDNTIAVMGSWSAIRAVCSAYTDAATFKAAMSGVMLYYELTEPVITDISDILPDDNLIGVVGGGTVTPVNKHGYAVPSKITYQLKGAEA